MKWNITNNIIMSEKGKEIGFELPIKEATEVEGILVVVLDVPLKETMPDNVFAINEECNIIWQVKPDPRGAWEPMNVFVGLHPANAGEITLINHMGVADVVDIRTGNLLRRYETK